MGFFNFIENTIEAVSNVASGTVDIVSNVASGTVDVVGNVASGTVDVVGNVVDVIIENPEKTALIIASTAVAAPVIAAAGTAAGAVGIISGAAGVATAGSTATTLFTGLGAATKSALVATEITANQAALGGFLAKQAGEHVIDNNIRDCVKPARGSVVYCDLACIAEHSGIYIGDGNIIHLDGSGAIEVVTKEGFINRLGGMNVAMSIYVSCLNNSSYGSESTANRAISMLGNKRNYNIIFNNCHQFTAGCITGDFDNSNNFLWMLKYTTEKEFGVNSWRVWS